MSRAGLSAAGALLVFALLGAPAYGACTTPQQVKVGQGPTPAGRTWTVTASIKNNGDSCRTWLFGVHFDVPGSVSGGISTAIPPGGHVKERYFGISAAEWEAPRNMSVLDGFTDFAAVRVVATMDDGSTLELHPRPAPPKLRHRAHWLAIFRYFVVFFPDDREVHSLSSFSRNGKRLATAERFENEFF